MQLNVLDKAAVGRPITRSGVSLFPIYLHQADGPAIVTGLDSGIVIAEQPDAEVDMLAATALPGRTTLLVEGETLVGGLQHRTLNVSVLVAPGATVDLPVSCVEQGRWGGGGDFATGNTFTSRRVRRAKHESTSRNLRDHHERHADQGQVWQAVNYELDRLDANNSTTSLVHADTALGRNDQLMAAIDELVAAGPLPGQRGVVVSHGNRVVAAEVFAEPDLLSAHWEALIRGALLDAPATVTGRPSANRALRFLRSVGAAQAIDNDGVGLGAEHHVRTSRVVAQALTWEDRLIHASAFALAG